MGRGERLFTFQKKVRYHGRLPLALVAALNAGIEVIIETIIQRNTHSLLLFRNAARM